MKKKFNKKFLTFGILGIFALALVTAGLIQYYGQIHQEVEVEQAVILDDGDEVITTTINGVAGEKFYSDEHWLTNNHPDDKIIVDFISTNYNGLTIYPNFKLDATIDDDAFYIKLNDNIIWNDFVSTSFNYNIISDGGNEWIPQMNVVLRDTDGEGRYYASWHSFRTGINGVVGEETSLTFDKGDFYFYELPSWQILGLWSDTQWIKDPWASPVTYYTTGETDAIKALIDPLQFDYFTRQAGDTSIDPNPTEAQQIVWLHSFTTNPSRDIVGYGIPSEGQGIVLQNLDFKLIYDFDYEATAGTYVIDTGIKFQDVI